MLISFILISTVGFERLLVLRKILLLLLSPVEVLGKNVFLLTLVDIYL